MLMAAAVIARAIVVTALRIGLKFSDIVPLLESTNRLVPYACQGPLVTGSIAFVART